MSMATMNVSLPDSMKAWVEAQADTGRYSNASDYVRDLIRRDQERADQIGDLQRLISEGLDSGVSPRSMSDILEAARARMDATSKRRPIASAGAPTRRSSTSTSTAQRDSALIRPSATMTG